MFYLNPLKYFSFLTGFFLVFFVALESSFASITSYVDDKSFSYQNLSSLVSSSSCWYSFRPVRNYRWSLTNNTIYEVSYFIDGKLYRISPGGTEFYNTRIGGGEPCGEMRYKRPIIRFDFSILEGVQNKRYRINVDEYRKFVFEYDNTLFDVDFRYLSNSRRLLKLST